MEKTISDKSSLPADVLWGLFVTHLFLRGGEMMRDKRTTKGVCGEATIKAKGESPINITKDIY